MTCVKTGMSFRGNDIPAPTRYSVLITRYSTSGSIDSISAITRKDRIARQAAGVCISIVRNLWRPEWLLGLRPARRRNAAQFEGRLVARDDPARRYRRPRRLHPH